jgi:membrane carboxypeptidase/penicillin-binding protein
MIGTRPPGPPPRLHRLHRQARELLAWVRQQERPDLTGRGWLDGLLLVGFGLVLVGLGAAVALYGYVSRDLPAPEQVFAAGMFQTAMIYDRKGRLLYELIDPQGGRRSVIALSEMPSALIDATVTTEDPNFYNNPGLDLKAVLRALAALPIPTPCRRWSYSTRTASIAT